MIQAFVSKSISTLSISLVFAVKQIQYMSSCIFTQICLLSLMSHLSHYNCLSHCTETIKHYISWKTKCDVGQTKSVRLYCQSSQFGNIASNIVPVLIFFFSFGLVHFSINSRFKRPVSDLFNKATQHFISVLHCCLTRAGVFSGLKDIGCSFISFVLCWGSDSSHQSNIRTCLIDCSLSFFSPAAGTGVQEVISVTKLCHLKACFLSLLFPLIITVKAQGTVIYKAVMWNDYFLSQ